MSKLVVSEPFYFGGAIREVGSEIEVENPADRKSLLDRGLISEGKAAPAPSNKMEPAPENKAEDDISQPKRRGRPPLHKG